MATKANVSTAVLELPVSFGNVSIGEKAARIGVSVDRSRLKIGSADKNLCGHRLTCNIAAVPAGDDPEQARLFDDSRKLEGVADVKGFAVTTKAVTFGLTFNIEDIDLDTLCHFAKRAGRLVVEGVERIPDEEEDDGEDEELDEEPAKQRKRTRRVAVDTAAAMGADNSDKDL